MTHTDGYVDRKKEEEKLQKQEFKSKPDLSKVENYKLTHRSSVNSENHYKKKPNIGL